MFHSRQLGEEKETIEQTRVGAIDLNRTNVAPIGSLIPAANVLALPFLFRSFDHLHKVLDQAIGAEMPGSLPAVMVVHSLMRMTDGGRFLALSRRLGQQGETLAVVGQHLDGPDNGERVVIASSCR